MEQWANRQFVTEDKGLSDHANGHAIGMCQAFQDILDVEANDLTGDNDGRSKQVGPEAVGPSGTH
jgi:hypothetical protein